MITNLNPEMVMQIEGFATYLLQLFVGQLEKCQNDIEYFNLLISSLVFQKMVLYHFENSLKEDNVDDVDQVVDAFKNAADEIFAKIVMNISKQSSYDLN